MGNRARIVKRKGHRESYDNHKVYASCYAACLNAHCKKQEAESICDLVTKEIDLWIEDKNEISSETIFRATAKAIEKIHQQASFMYETHRDIS